MSSQQSQVIFRKQERQITESLLKYKKADLEPETYKYLKSLEGQCRIIGIKYLRINYYKLWLIFIPVALTFLGLIALKLSKQFRVACLYTEVLEQSPTLTHVLVINIRKQIQVCDIKKINYHNEEKITFFYQNLDYQLYNGEPIPLGMNISQQIPIYMSEGFKSSGLSDTQVKQRMNYFGMNKHTVSSLSYVLSMYHAFTSFLFIVAILATVSKVFSGNPISSFVMLGVSIITINIEYFLRKQRIDKLKQMVQKSFDVVVLRNSKFIQIPNIELVPGDIYIPKQTIPCDSIILQGQAVANQVIFTGESIPIGKNYLNNIKQTNFSKHWIFQGTQILSTTTNILALAVATGYTTRRGQIIRRIVNGVDYKSQSVGSLKYLFIQIALITLGITFIFYDYQFSHGVKTVNIVFRIIDVVLYCVPPIFNIYFKLSEIFSSQRLQNIDISTLNPQKIIQTSRIETICFDKTGTLTQKKQQINSVISFQTELKHQVITESIDQITQMIFLSCSLVQLKNGQPLADEIDLALFQFVKGKLIEKNSQHLPHILNNDNFSMTILQIHQYQSRYQSMSVLAQNNSTGKVYIFAKGSPQAIHYHSTKKIEDYNQLVKDLCLSGFRPISYGYYQISFAQLQDIMQMNRLQHLQKIKISGLVAFKTQYKQEAYGMLAELKEAKIETKIITGDNIFVGIQAAFQLQIFDPSKRVMVIQGSRIDQNNNLNAMFLHYNNKVVQKQQEILINQFSISNYQNEQIAIDQTFILKDRKNFLAKGVKLFARVSPQIKGLVLKRHKQKIKEQFKNRKWYRRWFGPLKNKVCMIGDSANDLIAIKEANIGIGITETDSIYISNFGVRSLVSIIKIIKEGKSLMSINMEIIQYYLVSNLMIIAANLIIANDASNFGSLQSIYRQLIPLTGPIVCMLCFHPTLKKLSKFSPSSNFMGLQNHLKFWGTTILSICGMIGSYLFYYNSSDFEPNPESHEQWNKNTKSSTAMYITYITIFSAQSLSLIVSDPWKQSPYTNVGLLIFVIFHIILGVFFHIFSGGFIWFGFIEINRSEGAIMYGISAGTIIITYCYNKFIQFLKIYETETEH